MSHFADYFHVSDKVDPGITYSLVWRHIYDHGQGTIEVFKGIGLVD